MTFGHIATTNNPTLVYDGRFCTYHSEQPDEFSKFRPGCAGAENTGGINFMSFP